jgi:hypothetical protein
MYEAALYLEILSPNYIRPSANTLQHFQTAAKISRSVAVIVLREDA